jgi:hypothetical protein
VTDAHVPRAVQWPTTLPAGHGIKFSLQDPESGLHSSTWLVKTSKNRDDVYLAEIISSGYWKISHHNESPNWRIAMTKEGAIELGVERQVASEWSKPIPSDGWIEGTAVLIPKQYLGRLTSTLKNDVMVVPMSKEHNGVVIRLFFEEPGAVVAQFPAAYPIAVLERWGGGLAYVLAEPVTIEKPQLEQLELMCAEARDFIPEDDLRIRPRFVGVGVMDERRLVMDLTVNPG